MVIKINWECIHFNDIKPKDLYQVMQLRSEVFVVEQTCIYQDADGKDEEAHHVLGWDLKTLAACARILAPGISYEEASIGRVCTARQYRGLGVGNDLMKFAINKTEELYPKSNIKLSAQFYLLKFYQSHGFVQVSDIYLEDDIEHVAMKKIIQ